MTDKNDRERKASKLLQRLDEFGLKLPTQPKPTTTPKPAAAPKTTTKEEKK